MRVSCSIEIEYGEERMAESVLRSIEEDNTPYARAIAEESTLHISVEGRTISSLIHTLEDMLVCVKLSEEILRWVTPSPPVVPSPPTLCRRRASPPG